MARKRQGAIAAIVAAGLLMGFTLGTAASASPHQVRTDDPDYAEALAQKQAERDANEQLQDELQAALENTNHVFPAKNSLLQLGPLR